MGPPPSVTVLIPAHNEAASVAELVRACIDQPYPLDGIIVVADSCDDNTAQAAWEAGASRVLEVDFKDKAASQNAALWDIRSDCIVGFDGDTVPDRMCITRMIWDLCVNDLDATCATILPIQPKGFFIRARRFAYALGRRWWRLAQATVGRIQVLTGACYVFKTEAIKSVGGFPNGLISADMDATWALHSKGYRLGYAGSALAYTYDPETFTVYRNQMRRWSSGYFQNMAKYKRQLLNWRSILVVGTAVFDMCCLFAFEALLLASLITRDWHYAETVAIWTGVHAVVTTTLVATVVGPKEAILGFPCYYVVNYYNKWLYLCAMVREWILGRHYASWTGRQGRKVEITKMTAARRAGFGAIGVVLVAVGCMTWVGYSRLGAENSRQHHANPAVAAPPLTQQPVSGFGIITPSRSVAEVASFAKNVGATPAFAEYYLRWNQLPDPVFTAAEHKAGSETIISWSTLKTSLAAIASGQYDAYLRSFGVAARNLSVPIAVAFDPEFNGNWESWGFTHDTPAQYVAAWRHVHDVVTGTGATNITWLWASALVHGGTPPPHAAWKPIQPYWPGSQYVNWVGMDGYFWSWEHPPTYSEVFGQTVAAIRKFAPSQPMIIDETGGAGDRKIKAINQLFGALDARQIIGFVWFDVNAAAGAWSLDDAPAALAAFRADATPGKGAPHPGQA